MRRAVLIIGVLVVGLTIGGYVIFNGERKDVYAGFHQILLQLDAVGVVKDGRSWSHGGSVVVRGFGVHQDCDIVIFAQVLVPFRADSNLIPGWQALNIGWKQILGAHAYSHPEKGLEQYVIRGLTARSIDRSHTNRKVINTFFHLDSPLQVQLLSVQRPEMLDFIGGESRIFPSSL